MTRRKASFTAVVLALLALLTCTSVADARCRFLGRWRQRHCGPSDSCAKSVTPAVGTSDLRCPIYYSGKIGDVFVHYGMRYSTSCMTDPGPVNLDRQVCFYMCSCGSNLNYCVSISRFSFSSHEKDGIKKDAEPNAVLNLRIIDGSEILGNFPYKSEMRPLRLVRVKLPNGTNYGLAYELSDPQETDYSDSRIKQKKSRLGEVEHDGKLYFVLLRRDLDP